jgi:hypothetical protein
MRKREREREISLKEPLIWCKRRRQSVEVQSIPEANAGVSTGKSG